MEQMKYDVFISYSRKDTAIANKICDALDRQGISYFIDRQGIGGGQEFPDVLAKAIIGCRIMLYLASANSYCSKFTNNEITFAFNEKPKGSILPYVIDGSRLPDTQRFIFASVNIRTLEEHPIDTVLMQDLCLLLGREYRKAAKIILGGTLRNAEPTPSPSTKSTDEEKERKRREEEERRHREEEKWKRHEEEERRRETERKRLEEEQKRREEEKRPKEQTFTVGGVSFKMIRVQGGTFMMGATSAQGRDVGVDEWPVHQVTLSSYSIGETPVTQELWQAVMGNNPSRFKGAQRPVEQVSWNDCQEFIKKLNQETGKHFRLPTEAEWEFAARGGMKSKGYKYSGSNDINEVAWYVDNSYSAKWYGKKSSTHPVKEKKSNELGIYDMSGNVSEWCQDYFGRYTSSSQTNPIGFDGRNCRLVTRGGNWDREAEYCRVSSRALHFYSNYTYDRLGLRLALSE